nr:MAG TPA: hypothetical protein [Caudoviricetes sp.]
MGIEFWRLVLKEPTMSFSFISGLGSIAVSQS